MKRTLAFRLIACVLASAAIIVLLVMTSGVMKDRHNSFLREFPPHAVTEGDTLNLGYNSYYLAGVTEYTAYLGNSMAPLHVLAVNLTTLDTQRVRLSLAGIHGQKFRAPRLQVDSPYFYLSDGSIPVLYSGKVSDWLGERSGIDSIYFRTLVPITLSNFILRSLNEKNENIIGKLDLFTDKLIFKNDILHKQLDGMFCTDGMLRYDKASQTLVYVHYYRNEIIILDTSLTVIQRSHTLDTNRIAKISVSTIQKTGTRTMDTPPLLVNAGCALNGQWLFVHSVLLARNEPAGALQNGSVIDVYSLNEHSSYRFSFYINPRAGSRMQEFMITGNRMIVRYENAIRVFTLAKRYFDKPS